MAGIDPTVPEASGANIAPTVPDVHVTDIAPTVIVAAGSIAPSSGAELVPDAEFDTPSMWLIEQIVPQIPSGTWVIGGRLIVGTDLIPPILSLGVSIVTPVPALAAEIGKEYEYEIDIPVFVAAPAAGISFGGHVLWDAIQGSGVFTGSIVATTTEELTITSVQAGYEIEKLSIIAVSGDINPT